MTRHTDDTIDAALGSLDPAPRTVLTDAERSRADSLYARVVATPSTAPTRSEPVRSRRRTRGLWATAGLVGGAAVAVPAMLLGGGSAYGSWTPTPETLTGSARSEAAATCRGTLGESDGSERVEVAERRGDWTYVLLASPGSELICLMPEDAIGTAIGPGDHVFGSHDADPPPPPTLEPDQIDENTSAEGSTDEGWFAWSEGYVGRDVTGVTVHTSSAGDIEASVTGGRFAAWWPSSQQSSRHPAETWSYTVHLADGSTRRSDG